MKSYLDLIKEYNHMHHQKNRITVLCIVIAVSLVNTIFGMADIGVRSQILGQIKNNGNFHIAIKNIDEKTADSIASRSDVEVAGWIQSIAAGSFGGKALAISAGEKIISEQMNLVVEQGKYPDKPDEALLDKQALQQFSIKLGQTVNVNLADGSQRSYKIVGVYKDFSNLKATDAHGLFLTYDAGKTIATSNDRSYYYVQFKKHVAIRKAVDELKKNLQLSDAQVAENTSLLGLLVQSDNPFMIQLYMTAMVLFVLVLVAGTIMIASNFNMSVMQRIQFFGLLRCLGASKAQVKRFVLLEGLYLSVKAIPIGLVIGTAVVWGLSAFLKYYNAAFFAEMPLFQVSSPAIILGTLVGFLSVILASLAPSKKASAVSPLSAVTGNINDANTPQAKKALSLKKIKVESAMGMSHAFANKKNMILMSASFAISIVLFLSFSVMITFMVQALKPLKPYSPDVSISATNSQSLSKEVVDKIKKIPGIKKVYGRMFAYDIKVVTPYGNEKMMLISYEQNQFNWAKKDLIKGYIKPVEAGQNQVLVAYNEDLRWNLEDKIRLADGQELNVAGLLSKAPFDRDPGTQIVICSEETFSRLTRNKGYTIIDIQLSTTATDETVSSIRKLVDVNYKIYDKRQSNIEARTMFYSMGIFIYGFLAVIALITVINIINSMNISVSIRLNYYGIMRAVGMTANQIWKMVLVEAMTYVMSGCLIGCLLAIPLHKFLFESIITFKWAIQWTIPLQALLIIISISVITTFLSIIWPIKKIKQMDIVKVINAA